MSFEYIEVLYNRKRQHSSLGYKSPIRFLDDWLITQQKEKLVARTSPLGRRKTGGTSFSIPLAAWLKGGAFRALFNEVLRDPKCSFDAGTVDSLLRGQDRGRSNGERLFALMLFKLWRREYGVTF